MTGLILDAVLMLLLVAALGYGIRLERKLSALRAGQLAFAGAVTELNAAAGRAENALASLRASGEEADLLHDRIVKARAVKQELEILMNRAAAKSPSVSGQEARSTSPSLRDGEETIFSTPPARDRKDTVSSPLRSNGEVARRDSDVTEGLSPQIRSLQPRPAQTPVLQALAANHAAQESLNRARRRMDEDLFAA